jgi:UDPglucose--hexose-1-phosphate uridylyltransferase
MNEVRHDLISGQSVIIAPERAARPIEMTAAAAGPQRTSCDFCDGHESATPGETFAIRPPGSEHDQPGWQVRIIPNKYPAVVFSGGAPKVDVGIVASVETVVCSVSTKVVLLDSFPSGETSFSHPARGIHEVIVETPRHVTRSSDLSDAEWHDVLRAYQTRLQQLQTASGFAYVLIFKNVGWAAGASMEHMHSQLVATRFPTSVLSTELTNSQRYYATHGSCPFCFLLDGSAERLVLKTQHFVAFCPYAARSPYETWILPTHHEAHFPKTPAENLSELASVLRRVLVRLEKALSAPAYNVVLHTAPFDTGPVPHYHWHIEIIPRVTSIAGFELGSGYYINPIPPEDAARCLRDEIEK